MKINVELKNVTYNKHNNLEEIEITENGEYTASEGYDAIGKANVNVQPNLEEIEITENGEYTPSENYQGFSKVDVNVHPDMTELEVTENGEYLPEQGVYGFSKVIVDIVNPQLEPIISYSDNIISWNVEDVEEEIYSSVFINDINIYNGYENSCLASNKVYGDNIIKINVFEKDSMLTGSASKTIFIPNATLTINLEYGQSLVSLKFDENEVIYTENMEIPVSIQNVKIIVSKIDETYSQENRSKINYRNFEYVFTPEAGDNYLIKPYNLPILSISDRVSATECKSSDNQFIAKTDSEWSENEGSAYKLFDMNEESFWNSLRTNFPHWIQLYNETPIIIKSLSLNCRSSFYNNEFPKRIELIGSNDDSEYSMIDELIVETRPVDNYDSKTFKIDNNNSYKYYKLNIYSTFGSGSGTGATSISELSFTALRE